MSKYKLGDVCEFINGGAWSDKEYVLSGIPVLKVSNCKNSGFVLDELDYLPEESREKYSKNELKLGDVIIATVGSHPNLKESAAGRSCVVNVSVEGFFLNQNAVCIRTKSPEIVNQKYLGYLTASFPFQHHIQMRGRGAANQMRIAIGSIKEYEHSFPDIRTQHRIAGIISAYDALIENNQKQIKLLEEAAQRLYKEWFIDLRFPGHESTPIHDGIPDGWERYPFSQKVSVMSGGTPKTEVKEYYGGSIPFFSPKDHNGSFFAFQTATTITDAGLANCNSPLYPENTIIITARGTVGKTVILAVPMAMNQSCYALKSGELNLPYYLFFALNTEVQKLRTMSNGGVFDTIIVKTFNNIEITFPANNLAASFEKTISPIMEQIKTKMREIMTLTEARDRLLPKLMSGEIEV